MDRGDRQGVATFYWPEVAAAEDIVPLTGDVLRHALVRRLGVGDAVRLVSGRGTVAAGRVHEASRTHVSVVIEGIVEVARPVAMEILAPIGDRDRMLWAAEKCVELQATAWRPVLCERSRSVASRGEGPKFAEKVGARMRGALEQSGGAWLPDMHSDSPLAEGLRGVTSTVARFVLDPTGEPLAAADVKGPVALLAGPEGGLESGERDLAASLGWRLASLGGSVLRFETALVSAAAVVRALQHSYRSV